MFTNATRKNSTIYLDKEIKKFMVLSDLHTEFGPLEMGENPGVDLVLLAGDIGVKTRGVQWAKKAFATWGVPVLYIAGNHEYYGGSLGYTLEKMRQEAHDSCVLVLENQQVRFSNFRVLGATLWTDFKITGEPTLAQLEARNVMNDYKRIRDEKFSKLKPMNVFKLHYVSKFFIEEALSESFDGATLCMTHHAPTGQSIPERYVQTGGHLNAAYASELESLFDAKKVQMWIHGHIHDSIDKEVAQTQIVCNPRGYAPSHLNDEFELYKTLSVDALLDKKLNSSGLPAAWSALASLLDEEEAPSLSAVPVLDSVSQVSAEVNEVNTQPNATNSGSTGPKM